MSHDKGGKFDFCTYQNLARSYTSPAIAAVMASFNCCTSDEGEKRSVVPLLECSEAVTLYTIPSFSVLTVKLRKIKLQCFVADDSGVPAVKIVDGFIKDHFSLNRAYPAEITVGYSGDGACLVSVCCSIIITIIIIIYIIHQCNITDLSVLFLDSKY